MTKAAICVGCSDIVSPYPEPASGWRWCCCRHVAVRWRDPHRGLLDVTALHGPTTVRVLGLNNAFLAAAVQGRPWGEPEAVHEEWRLLHDQTCEDVEPHYLFSERKRQCWAVVIRPGETGDVRYVENDIAFKPRVDDPEPPASSADRAPHS